MREPMLVLDRGDQYVTIGTGGIPTVWMVKPNGASTPMTDKPQHTVNLAAGDTWDRSVEEANDEQ